MNRLRQITLIFLGLFETSRPALLEDEPKCDVFSGCKFEDVRLSGNVPEEILETERLIFTDAKTSANRFAAFTNNDRYQDGDFTRVLLDLALSQVGNSDIIK